MVNGTFWAAAAVRPVILGMGAVFAALDMDIQPLLDVQLFEMSNVFKMYNSGRRKKSKDPYALDEDEEEEREEREERMREAAAEGEQEREIDPDMGY